MSKKNKKKQKKGIIKLREEEPKTPFYVWIVSILFTFFFFYYYFGNNINRINLEYFFSVFDISEYIPNNITEFLKYNLKNLFLGVYVFVSICLLGVFIVSFLPLEVLLWEELLIYSSVIGFASVILFSMFTGFLGFIYKEVYIIFSMLSVFSGLYVVFVRKKFSALSTLFKKDILEFKFYFFIIFYFIFLNLIQALSPEIFYDSLIYHLAVPNYWIIKGKITDLAHNMYSKLTLNHSLIYMYSMLLGNDITPKMLSFFTSIVSLTGIVYLFRKYFEPKTTVIAGVIFYSVFHFTQVSNYTSTDGFLTLFIMCYFYFMIKLIETDFLIYAVIAGILAGISLGIKYSSVFMVMAPFLIYIYRNKNRPGNILKVAMILFASGFLFIMPWLIKNYILYSNPVFPLLTSLFNKNLDSTDIENIKKFISEVKQFNSFNIKQWILHPFLISSGRIINSEFFTPIFLLIMPLGIFNRKRKEIITYLWIFFIISWLSWSFTSNVIRYLMPAYFAASLITAYYISEAFDKNFRKYLSLIFIFTVFLSLYHFTISFYLEGRWKVVFNKISYDEWLSHPRPRYTWPSYPVIKYINQNLDKNSKILFFGDAKTFYIKRNFDSSSVFDKNILIEITKHSRNGDEIYKKLKEMGFTHILFNYAEAKRYQDNYKVFSWNDRDLNIFNDFFNMHLEEIEVFDEKMNNYLLNKVILYRIVDNSKTKKTNYITLLFKEN